MFNVKSSLLMKTVVGGVALATMAGCDSDELTYEIPRPAGLTIQRPLAQENKTAYMEMIKDKRNARFPNMDRDKLEKYIDKDLKITTYEGLVKRLGPPDEIVFYGPNATRGAVYYNLVFHDNFVASVSFHTGYRSRAGMSLNEYGNYHEDITKARANMDRRQFSAEFFIPKP